MNNKDVARELVKLASEMLEQDIEFQLPDSFGGLSSLGVEDETGKAFKRKKAFEGKLTYLSQHEIDQEIGEVDAYIAQLRKLKGGLKKAKKLAPQRRLPPGQTPQRPRRPPRR